MNVIKRVLLVSALLLLIPGAVAAQSTPEAPGVPQPFASGIGETATYVDDRGNSVLELTVDSVERDWDGYERYSEPQVGSDYVLVTFTVTNLSSRVYVLEMYDFKLIDSIGVAQDRAYVSSAEVTTDDTSIDGGASVQVALVFEVFSDIEPLVFLYQPDYSVYVIIYLGNEN